MRFAPSAADLAGKAHPGRGLPVMHTDTGMVYGSVAAAARVAGVDEKTMRRWLRDPSKPFVQVPKTTTKTKVDKTHAKAAATRVLNLATGDVYASVAVAAKALGVKPTTVERWARDPTAPLVLLR